MSSLQETVTAVVISLLGDLSNSFIAKIWNVNENFNTLEETLQKNLKELQQTLKRIHDNKACLSYTQIPSDWLDELVWCRYEIEDAIDSFNLSVSKQTLTTRMLQANLDRIRALQNKLEGVETKLSNRQTDPDQASIGRCRASLHVSPSLELLRVKDKEAIIAELKSHQFGVSILGICGTGKTKLAQTILDDESIKKHFSCILSPPQSRDFNLKSMLECLNNRIQSKKERVLIQLDGLQSVTPEDWYYFQSKCRENPNLTSKVLITTQNPRVVDVTGSHKYCLHTHTLSDEDCLNLIRNRAGANRNLHEDDLRAIEHNEKELVEKCKGLPLLANHIGLLLSAEAPGKRDKAIRTLTTRSMWKQSGLERVLLDLTPISMLAQKPHLQRCVAYCSLFPPDHDFTKDRLIQLWMVEGFTQAPSATDDAAFLEQIASECFDDLLSHSIFQALELMSDEEPSYKMHPLLYDFAQNVASKTFCRVHVGNSDSAFSPYTRHLSLSCENIENHEEVIPRVLKEIATCNGLRTFLLLHNAGAKISQNPTFFEKLECLRVLDLSHANLTKLSNISKLKHLRYLDLSHTPIKRLPSLSKNPALLVLKLDGCDLLQCLPNDLSKLTNLISLHVNTKSLGAMPQFIGKLSKLQTLNAFIVGKDEGYKIAELKKMNDLREPLCITKLENVKTKSKAQEAMLHDKKRLQSLELQWSSFTLNESAKEVLEGLQPPKNLKELTISKYGGFEFPQWLGTPEVCGMLKTIYLSHCEACTVLPSLWQLQMLKTLHLEAMNALTSLGPEFFGEGFQSLESLKLCDLPNLTEWTHLTDSYLPRLCELQIIDCPRLAKLPPMDHLTSLETLEIHDCAQLEELPILSLSVKSLIIIDSDILRQRCQVGNPDWHKIKGINVVIDSERVDTGEQNQPAPDEVVIHQSNATQIEVSTAANDTDSRDQLAEHRPQSLVEMDIEVSTAANDTNSRDQLAEHRPQSLAVMDIEVSTAANDTDSRDQLAEHRPQSLAEMDVSEDLPQQVTDQHLSTSLMVYVDQIKRDQSAKRQRRSNVEAGRSQIDHPFPSPYYGIGKWHPSTRLIEVSTAGNDTDSRNQLAEHHPQSLAENPEMDISEDLHQQFQPASLFGTLDDDGCLIPTGLENQGADLDEEFGLSIPAPEVEKEVDGKNCSESKRHQDELHSVVSSSNLECSPKEILLLLGEGYEFEKEMLIQLWIALGFLKDEPKEVIGINYFEELVSEEFISCSVANSLYTVNTEKLIAEVDMIRDKRTYIVLDSGSRNDDVYTETLHVSVLCDKIDETIFKRLGRFSKLRSLLFLGNYGSRLQQVPRDLFMLYESLVALDLSGTHIKELPSSTRKMIHLRYLDLSWTFIELLPERIDRFQALQTLKLKGCSHLCRLPKEIKKLIQLRHLDLDVLRQLTIFPKGMGALVNLRTLSAFPVGTDEGLKISELKYMNNLTGEFCIAKLENVQSAGEANEASLIDKNNIKKLELRWSRHHFQGPKNEDVAILDKLRPYSDLEEIKILCYHGSSLPSWIADVSFHKLVSITLLRCENVLMLPSLQKLPSLESLELVGLNSVIEMNCRGEVDHAAFPKLRKLAIDGMLSLESCTKAQEGDYPSLVELSIKDCPKLHELPSFFYLPSLEHLEVIGCTKLTFVSEKQLSTSLQQLILEDCPLIKDRCSEQGTEDWYLIQHVPTIWIDQVAVKKACEDEENDESDW